MLQSTPRSRGATAFPRNTVLSWIASIHAPLTRSDSHKGVRYVHPSKLQSTPRSRGATFPWILSASYLQVLQSTPRSRGATQHLTNAHKPTVCFNPRPAHAERHIQLLCAPFRINASIHAPLTRSDPAKVTCSCNSRRLQSTPRSRGATCAPSARPCLHSASIHAPLTRSDRSRTASRPRPDCFNPRPAHAERPEKTKTAVDAFVLQSTPRSRGATANLTNLHLQFSNTFTIFPY